MIIVSYTAHFSHCLRRYPDSLAFLEPICAAWKKYGRIPARITLRSHASSIAPVLLEMFGPGALHLSGKGSVALVTDKLFCGWADAEKIRWITAVHEACGIPFEQKKMPGSREEEFRCAINKWKLVFPQLGELAHVLSKSHHSGCTVQEQLDLWIQAGEIVTFLLQNTDALTVSDLGARFCGDSKKLRGGAMLTLVADLLVCCDTGIGFHGSAVDPACRKTLRKHSLERHGVVENRCSVGVTVFGPLVFEKNGKRVDHVLNMWEQGEPALLSLENLDTVGNVEIPAGCRIYTCENESPFANLVRGKFPEILIYTQGFPNSAVCKLYGTLAGYYPDRARFHWGDTDLPGLQIAAMLHKIAPLQLWRCDLDTVSAHRSLLIGIDEKEKKRIRRFLRNNPDFAFHDVLEFTCRYGWLEQEHIEGFVSQPGLTG